MRRGIKLWTSVSRDHAVFLCVAVVEQYSETVIPAASAIAPQGARATSGHIHSFGRDYGVTCRENGHPFQSHPINVCREVLYRSKAVCFHHRETGTEASPARVPFSLASRPQEWCGRSQCARCSSGANRYAVRYLLVRVSFLLSASVNETQCPWLSLLR